MAAPAFRLSCRAHPSGAVPLGRGGGSLLAPGWTGDPADSSLAIRCSPALSARDLLAVQEAEPRPYPGLAARLEGGLGSVGGLAPLAACP